MDNMENMENELQHHGVKGMKWGVRRTPAQLGHRTPIRKKLASRWEEVQKRKVAKAAEKAEKRTKKLQGERSASKKAMHDMTDEELAAAINRARMEDAYRSMRPEKVSAGKRFIRSLGSDVIAPAAKNAGKKFLEDALNKVGANLLKDQIDPNSLEGLKQQFEKAKYRHDIAMMPVNLELEKQKLRTNEFAISKQGISNREARAKYRKFMRDNFGEDELGNPLSDTELNKGKKNKNSTASDTESASASKNKFTTDAKETNKSEGSGVPGTGKIGGLLPVGTKSKQDGSSKTEKVSLNDPGVSLVNSKSNSDKSAPNKKTTSTIVLDDDQWSDISSPQGSAASAGKSAVSGYLNAPASSSTASNRAAITSGKSTLDDIFKKYPLRTDIDIPEFGDDD